MENKRNISVLELVFISSFFLFGLFKEYSSCIYTFICGLLLAINWNRVSKITVYFNFNHFTIWVLTAGYFFTCFYGTDRGMSFIGLMKFLGVLFFLGLISPLNNFEKSRLFQMIPFSGVIMTFIGIIGWFISPMHQFFYIAERLGGFFQYPNVYALFCLLGILLIMEDFQLHPKSGIFIFSTLFLGILLSGSRTVFFLSLLSLAVIILRRKIFLKFIFPTVFLLIVVVVIYSFVSGNTQNLGRFLTSSFSSSTLIGRIIYWKDGFHELLRHPFGLGYLGYYFKEFDIQTASYSVRYIHNDFLQLALDTGIFPGILFILMCIQTLFFRKMSLEKKLCITVMCLHFFMDFDLEFTSMWYIFLLFTANDHNPTFLTCKTRKSGICFCILVSCLSLYVGLAMFPRYLGKQQLTARMLPIYTENTIELLSTETDPDTAAILANRILKQNPYIYTAYDIKALLAFQSQDYENLIHAKEKSLSLQKYNIEAYDNYLNLLSLALTDAVYTNNKSAASALINAALNVPEILEKVKQDTTPLAYHTKDAPSFTLSSSSMDFLQQLSSLSQ